MRYTFEVYKAKSGHDIKGYVYARSQEEAAAAWQALHGLELYYDIKDAAKIKHDYPADHFERMDEAEFYQATEDEGGFVIMLAPDELADRIIEASHTHDPHVFYLVGLDDD
jgi:hypothetical protein